MSHWRRTPRPLGLALEPVRDGLAPESTLAEVLSCWREAVGASIADQAAPTSERAGVLTISCSASVWAQELDLMGPAIVERINQLLGGERIVKLRCVSLPLAP